MGTRKDLAESWSIGTDNEDVKDDEPPPCDLNEHVNVPVPPPEDRNAEDALSSEQDSRLEVPSNSASLETVEATAGHGNKTCDEGDVEVEVISISSSSSNSVAARKRPGFANASVSVKNACPPSKRSKFKDGDVAEFSEQDVRNIVHRFLSRHNVMKEQNSQGTGSLGGVELQGLDEIIAEVRSTIQKRRNVKSDATVTGSDTVPSCSGMGPPRATVIDVVTLDDEVSDVEIIPDPLAESSRDSNAAPDPGDQLRNLPRNENGHEFVPRRFFGEDNVIAQRQGTLSKCWVQGRYLRRPSPDDEHDYVVQFGQDSNLVEEKPPLTCVAVQLETIWVLPGHNNVRVVARVGNGLLSLHTNPICTCPVKKVPHYLPGTILSARVVNKTRNALSHYVIAFDDGQICNVRHRDVCILLDGLGKDILDAGLRTEVYPETNKFILDFSKTVNWKYMVRENCLGDIHLVWREGKWQIARVEAIEDEMVNVTFERTHLKHRSLRTSEWIFRGSPRFRRNMEANEPVSESPAVVEQRLTNRLMGFEGIVKKLHVPEVAVSHSTRGHSCDSGCTRVNYDPSLHPNDISPLCIPFWFGWICDDFAGTAVKSVRCYTAPCGRRIRRYADMCQYLQSTESNLNVDWFNFSSRFDLRHVFKLVYPNNFLKTQQNFHNDISEGEEQVPLEIINTVDGEHLPNFKYSTKYVPADDVEISNVKTCCCDCDDGCVDMSRCACWKRTLEGMKDITPSCSGYQERKLIAPIPSGIFECNEKCSCRRNLCSNRVVQNGTRWPLQVFKTTGKGWAVRTLVDVPKGSFVCCYAGRLTTETVRNEDDVKVGDDYLVNLHFISTYTKNYMHEASLKMKSRAKEEGGGKDTEIDMPTTTGEIPSSIKVSSLMEQFPPGHPQYMISSQAIGNVGRFFSHSCHPNMFVQDVFVYSHDVRFPVLAFFTSDDVYAGMELTWDYEVGSVGGKSFNCECGSKYCRGRILQT